MDKELFKIALDLARHARRHNLPDPVLTVAPEWYDYLRSKVGLSDSPIGKLTELNFIKVEVDYKRDWRK